MVQHSSIDHTGITGVGVGDASAHIADATDAHDASAISIVDAGTYFTGTDVEAALQELGAGGGGSVATDAIWDAAGDLAVGTGANTAAKLTKGSDGEVLTMVAGAVDWAAPAGGGGDLTRIAETVLGSNQADITITGISGAYRDLILVFRCRSSNADEDGYVRLRVGNGSIDTGTNYGYHRVVNGSGAASAGGASGESYIEGILRPGSSASSGSFGGGQVTIINYASTAQMRTMFGDSYCVSASTHYLSDFKGVWRNTSAAIDQVRIYSATGDLVTGSALTIYGRG
jgi:hypothetical protein